MVIISLIFISILLVCIFVFSFYGHLIETKMKRFIWKIVQTGFSYVVIITKEKNSLLMKNIGHFQQKKNSDVL